MKPIADIMSRMGKPQERGGGDAYAGGHMTEHGWFSHEEVVAIGARFLYDRNGERVIQFPPFRDIPEYVVDQHERSTERA